MFQRTMNSSLVLKSSTFENGKYQHFFAGDFAQGSRAGKGDLANYFCAADYLRLPKFSLTNSCIFRENTQFFTKIVVVGSGDRTTCPTPVPVFQVVKRLEL